MIGNVIMWPINCGLIDLKAVVMRTQRRNGENGSIMERKLEKSKRTDYALCYNKGSAAYDEYFSLGC